MTELDAATGQVPPWDPEDGQGPADERTLIENRKQWLRIQRAASAEIAAECARPIPPSVGGAAFLSQPPEPARYSIARLAPAGGNVLITAQAKTGKTTIRDNLIRSLCDMTPFLGRYGVAPWDGRLYVVDAELAPDMARRWLADQMITEAGRFEYHNIRGGCSSFAINVPSVRRTWAARIRDAGAQRLILDCLGPVLAALGLDENKPADVGAFLSCYEELLAEAGISGSWTVHHMGHQEERSRGASRLRDWPDAEWLAVRQDTADPRSPRFLSAHGRDVDVREFRLDYDPRTRHLAAATGTRTEARTDDAHRALLVLLAAEPGQSARQIEEALCPAHTQKAVRAALRAAVDAAYVETKPGPRNARLHSITEEGRSASVR